MTKGGIKKTYPLPFNSSSLFCKDPVAAVCSDDDDVAIGPFSCRLLNFSLSESIPPCGGASDDDDDCRWVFVGRSARWDGSLAVMLSICVIGNYCWFAWSDIRGRSGSADWEAKVVLLKNVCEVGKKKRRCYDMMFQKTVNTIIIILVFCVVPPYYLGRKENN
jgi:hypothetical protein